MPDEKQSEELKAQINVALDATREMEKFLFQFSKEKERLVRAIYNIGADIPDLTKITDSMSDRQREMNIEIRMIYTQLHMWKNVV